MPNEIKRVDRAAGGSKARARTPARCGLIVTRVQRALADAALAPTA